MTEHTVFFAPNGKTFSVFNKALISSTIVMNLDEIVEAASSDIEDSLTVLMSDRLTGSPLLHAITYQVVGFDEDSENLIIKVTGNISDILDDEDDSEY